MVINYKILKDKNLLVQQYVGAFSIKDYVSYVYKVKKNPNIKHVERILTDMREVSANNTIQKDVVKKMDWLIKFRNKIIKKSYKNVFIVDSPETIATIHLYQNGGSNKKLPYQYCDTLSCALIFLELNEDKEEIVNILNSFIALS